MAAITGKYEEELSYENALREVYDNVQIKVSSMI